MITFEGTRITEENRSLLRQDLTGREVICVLEDVQSLADLRSDIQEYGQKNAWTTASGELCVQFILLRQTHGSLHESNSYVAIVTGSENYTIRAWDIVELDGINEGGRDWTPDNLATRFFGLRNYGAIPLGEILGTESLRITIQEYGGDTYLETWRKAFELHPGASVYNGLLEDTRKKKLLQAKFDRCTSLVVDLAAVRKNSPERYTEVTYWKEYEARRELAELRTDLFGHIDDLFDLEEEWFYQIRDNVQKGKIIVPEMSEAYVRRNSQTTEEALKQGDLYFTISEFEQKYTVRLKYFKKGDLHKDSSHMDHEQIQVATFRIDDDPFPEVWQLFRVARH